MFCLASYAPMPCACFPREASGRRGRRELGLGEEPSLAPADSIQIQPQGGLGRYPLVPGALRGLWCLQMAPGLPTSCVPGPSTGSFFVYREKELRLSGLGARENRFEETCLSGRLHHFTSLTLLSSVSLCKTVSTILRLRQNAL